MRITPVIDSVLLLTLLWRCSSCRGRRNWLRLTSFDKCTKMRYLHLQNKKKSGEGDRPSPDPSPLGEEIPSPNPTPTWPPPMKISGYALAFHPFVCWLHEVAVTYSIGSNNLECFESSDNTLFSAILNNPDHVLRFLPPPLPM